MTRELNGWGDGEIPHPYAAGMVVIGGLTALAIVPVVAGVAMVVAGRRGVGVPLTLIGGLLWLLFAVALAITWWSGRRQATQVRGFLAGDRALIRWTYDAELWAQIQAERWEMQLGDGGVQVGCLAVLFGLVGLMTGMMVGAEAGRWAAGALVGGIGGGLVGAAIGGVVAGTSRLAASWARRRGPETVALGRDEVYVNGQYFRGNGHTTAIAGARIRYGNSPVLVLDLKMPRRPRMPEVQTWEVVVPPNRVQDVQELIRKEQWANERQHDTV